ncbi:MAG: autotransporter outer membrane beta-barrel domain-containing protein [Verrucomicrobiales bacterium]|jgi:outer membrane autotransporter protein|nr:autotransporter outer membrane beta-barrel domain-containing protein [Verrucomicrobiales bacterium]
MKKTTLILTILSALSVSALNVFAQNFVVTSDTTVSGTHYENNATQAALTNTGTWTFTGSALTLTGTADSGNGQHGALTTGSNTLNLTDSVINAYRFGVLVSGGGTATLRNLSVNVTGTDTRGVRNSSSRIVIIGGTITSDRVGIEVLGATAFTEATDVCVRSAGFGASVTGGGASTLILNNADIIADQDGVWIQKNSDEEKTVIINGGAILARQGSGINFATQTGVVSPGTNTVAITGGARISGAAAISSNVNVAVHATVSDHSILTGGVSNSGSGALTVELDHSTLTGDITNQDDGPLVITLANHSTGTGGYHGGDLLVDGDSAWTFDKDSHGNNGENHGIWNIGDYDVTFDNMTNDGIINISVNSDTGEGGSVTITDTADGDGTIHIDTTGNGKLNPNDVLPGIVSGDGTENWQWDPIDWGIDTIIKDGDHFIKQGTSPAGAVLNSSVAVQQAMWFAQQNSLLKRMGELRYGARASRPPAGETPALHIIENIWLRSYGQQLNIGSQVSGKAYEQLIYGVDLGTDHKFTISADSDLYLGVYAGYGRSDIDYRTPGADGELNSYYGGLYATWLHSSGFYIDATVKAANVDNDLKALHGGTQLKANYSDVNLGGSLELGKKFTFSDAWFIEPQFQVNYLHILAEDYTAGHMNLKAQDLDALQLRIGSLFGRTINLTNSGALQPYVKISGVETISSGGTIRNGYQATRANTDGARAELGAGLIWQLDTNNQLHLDYEASFGDKYDKPWGLTAGYRHQF